MAKTPELARNQRVTGAERSKLGNELLKRYEKGASIREICAETGYSIGRVRRLLVDAGVEFRGRGGTQGRTRKDGKSPDKS
jgi:DNA-directed RNA polymerase specialized sigma24 family protein